MAKRSVGFVLVLLWGCTDPPTPQPDAVDSGVWPSVAGLTGTWTGYVENYRFPSGSDSIRVTIEADNDGIARGLVVLGDGDQPPPPTDALAGYPPATPGADADRPVSDYWHEGFTYTMVAVTASATRLRFSIHNFELWKGWCALQNSPDNMGMCLPRSVGMVAPGARCSLVAPASGEEIGVDCGKYNLCVTSRVCSCPSSPCKVDLDAGSQMAFDLAITVSDAIGSLVESSVGRANVRLAHSLQ